ncbi:recombinase family protein [Flavobacterium zhairuonense]|uniref:recombinase family protein n=1 Tax=Flavobacterium zhairuonense TaxID=2493631 RepID=UPI0010488AC6|nr:recombinase family protein [Flavobacterium zhairuonense]KAF2512111.1 recombinase family protein [Flavobacterium zhairuonense]
MYYFYSRISTAQQNSSRQLENFKSHIGYDAKKVFIEKIQGNIPFFERPEANKMFDEITDSKERCTVVVDSVDRLGRNLMDILHTIETFTKNEINLKSLKEGFTTLLDNGQENPMAKLVISVMASIGEMERNRIKSRTAEGIAIAKAMGKFTGRKFGTTQSDEKLLQRHQSVSKKLQKGLSVREITEITGASSATIIKVKKVMRNRNMI